ncbi:MAG: LytTR family DNA-binding domain-containing protein [Lachnospiraceae bacterium]|nr:LytTR family DNA-binding domain-containing protein [Lachnospiraceae bacterium]
MKILICDDNLSFTQELKQALTEQFTQQTQIYTCQDRQALLSLLSNEGEFDLLLMDICLIEDNGMQLARDILETYPKTAVIFITGYPDLYYEKVFLNVRPYGFVRKPVKKNLLFSLIHQCIEEREKTWNDCMVFKTKAGIQKIPVSTIWYLESQKHIVLIHTKSEVYETYGQLSSMQKMLPAYFLYCHKSFIVNAHYIRSYEGDRFYLKNGTSIPISQLRRKDTRIKFFQYLDEEKLRL